MSQHLNELIASKIKGISAPGDLSTFISAGAIDILEKLKTYKDEELQKFIIEKNVVSEDEDTWTTYNATSVFAFEVMGVKRSSNIVHHTSELTPGQWKTATLEGVSNKDVMGDPNSLKFIASNFPAYIVESHSNTDSIDGDNDLLAISEDNANYIITVFPQVSGVQSHAWKIMYIPVPVGLIDTVSNFHSSYIPALAVYCAKNIVLGEMNRLLLEDEDMELAGELKNHYALLEQEYASLMNIPPKKEESK